MALSLNRTSIFGLKSKMHQKHVICLATGKPNKAMPSLQYHYSTFNTTMHAPSLYFASVLKLLRDLRLSRSLNIEEQIPKFRTNA